MNTTSTDPRRQRVMIKATPPAPSQISESDWDASFDQALAAELRRRATRRRAAFWLLAFVFAATMLGTTLPTPLYVIYQARWHFAASIVTLIFAVYAAGVLAALLLAGRSSDQAGRKPVLAVALAASALSTVVFIFAPDVGVLLAGRIVSGLSAGLMTGTATAALTELVPASLVPASLVPASQVPASLVPASPLRASAGRRASLVATAANMGGLGLGALVAGLFAQYAPHPTTLVFVVYLAVLAIAAVCLRFVPETVSHRQRPALRLAGFSLPEQGRGEFIAAAAAAFAAFSLLGLFSALAPTFLGSIMHEQNHAVQGGAVFLIFGVGTLTQLLVSRFSSRRVVLAGLGLFLAGLGLIVAALAQAGVALFLAGTVVAGVAVGAVFMGSLATANRLAPPGRRGQAVSAFFVACYCGLVIPVVGVGVASQFIGDFRSVLALSILLAVLCVFALTSTARASTARTSTAQASTAQASTARTSTARAVASDPEASP
ncbi:MAG: MFS transporter [Streptosporangiaceae bacterium]